MNAHVTIPGYTYGAGEVRRSPVTLADFDLMKRTAAFGDEDVEHLRLSHDVLADQVDAILDVWYGFVGSHPHLLHSFTDSAGAPVDDYLTSVRARFGRWILDTARADTTLKPFLARQGHPAGVVDKMHAAWVKSCLPGGMHRRSNAAGLSPRAARAEVDSMNGWRRPVRVRIATSAPRTPGARRTAVRDPRTRCRRARRPAAGAGSGARG